MTAYQQPGPATQRIDHLVQFFRERNLSLTLLTRKSSLSQNAADSQTALSWRDFQQIITNARQVLPAHEFDQAAATFWQQPMHRHWVDLARVQRRPFGLLIDLIGEQGFLFEDMPLQIKVKQHDPRRLWIHADSRGESTSNIALSFLIAAEIKSFAALCGLSGFISTSRFDPKASIYTARMPPRRPLIFPADPSDPKAPASTAVNGEFG